MIFIQYTNLIFIDTSISIIIFEYNDFHYTQSDNMEYYLYIFKENHSIYKSDLYRYY